MTAKFMASTPYANTEFEMQMIPGFTPRRSGMTVSRFEYSVCGDDGSCCSQQGRKKKDTNPAGCVCLRERPDHGRYSLTAGISDALNDSGRNVQRCRMSLRGAPPCTF